MNRGRRPGVVVSTINATWHPDPTEEATDSEQRGTADPILGWQGRYFEDFVVGDIYQHPLGRTVIQPDHVWLTLLTQNTAPLH